MKHFLFLSIVSISFLSAFPECKSSTKPKPQTQQIQDDDEDSQVALSSVANILSGIGMLSTDPNNPAVVGPSMVQIGAGIITFISQMFKNIPLRNGQNTQEYIIEYFNNLPEQTQIQLIALLLNYAQHVNQLKAIAP